MRSCSSCSQAALPGGSSGRRSASSATPSPPGSAAGSGCATTSASRRWKLLASRAQAGWSKRCIASCSGLSCWRRPARSSAVACSRASRTMAASSTRRASKIWRVSSRRRHRDDGAAVGPQLHDVVVRQPLQHLAHHRTADAEHLAQRRLGQLGAGRQSLAHHAVEHGCDRCGFDVIARLRRASAPRGPDVASASGLGLGRAEGIGRCGAGKGTSLPQLSAQLARQRRRQANQRPVAARRAEQRQADRQALGGGHGKLTCGSPANPAMQVIAIVRRRTASTARRIGIAPRCHAGRRRQQGHTVVAEQRAHLGADRAARARAVGTRGIAHPARRLPARRDRPAEHRLVLGDPVAMRCQPSNAPAWRRPGASRSSASPPARPAGAWHEMQAVGQSPQQPLQRRAELGSARATASSRAQHAPRREAHVRQQDVGDALETAASCASQVAVSKPRVQRHQAAASAGRASCAGPTGRSSWRARASIRRVGAECEVDQAAPPPPPPSRWTSRRSHAAARAR